jgi:hypothetical protein
MFNRDADATFGDVSHQPDASELVTQSRHTEIPTRTGNLTAIIPIMYA